ncbi:MAG: RsmB/NOP family class I SAM-dependent RNA methyltransferase [Lachnospiraceae bacterium]|jgi:NOL1/NOP2/sun family putative RNA methylase
MNVLPKEYESEMKELLQEEYPEYLRTFSDPPVYGVRVNNRKISTEQMKEKLGLPLKRIPWIPNGFYYEKENLLSQHPYYSAGLYYLQEPSAMTPASRLPITPGDKVLDLCAAPGGKATELGARLQGQGILFANDISNSRARVLLKNLERMGLGNIFVTSETPEKLAAEFPGYFDKILLDAPCSGEGMFRREPSMIAYWEEKGPDFYSALQKQLLLTACQMLKPGGQLLYSTCTFALEENEENIAYVLQENPDMELLPIENYDGFEPGRSAEGMDLSACVRIFPHKMKGEGHFLALLHKKESTPATDLPIRSVSGLQLSDLPKACIEFLKPCAGLFRSGSFYMQKSLVYYLPKGAAMLQKLRYLRTGLFLGECKKNRFEPSQAFAMYLKKEQYPNLVELPVDDIRTIKYLKGETITLSPKEWQGKEGWQLVCTDGFPMGWGKRSKDSLKNKYAPGWRRQ